MMQKQLNIELYLYDIYIGLDTHIYKEYRNPMLLALSSNFVLIGKTLTRNLKLVIKCIIY